jgi:hydroxypyruvate isomerase
MLRPELPLHERIRWLGEHGLAAEIWDWSRDHVDLEAIARTGVPVLSMTGYLRGDLITEDGAEALLATARESALAARRLENDVVGVPRLNLHGTGLDGAGLPVRPVPRVTGEMWVRATRTLTRIAELGEAEGVVFELENLNLAVDHPGTPFARPADTLALVRGIDSPHLRLNLDLYHAQIGDGNLVETCREALPWIGQIQVADVPGRCEPGTGEISYPAVAAALQQMGYRGIVALEAWAATEPEAALTAFVEAFTPAR